MYKLPISIGILAWQAGQTLIDTLITYQTNRFFELFDDVKILFQECQPSDIEIAKQFNLTAIGLTTNVGIGKGFLQLAHAAKYDHILLLEDDWQLIENKASSFRQLNEGMRLIQSAGIKTVRYRHSRDPGYPVFSRHIKGNEFTYCPWHDLYGAHLLESVYWLKPEKEFPDKVTKKRDFWLTTSRWANFTNNPCLYNKHFYIQLVESYAGTRIDLERNISAYWSRQHFPVAQAPGLFKHVDIAKYGNRKVIL